MSDDEMVASPPGISVTEELDAPEVKPRYKSWRKKYRKMKTRFDDMMKSNSSMFKEEQKLEVLSKRLREQNDQLLDLLLDLNSSLQIPHTLRYNVELPAPPTELDNVDLDLANRMLIEATEAMRQGHFPQYEFIQLRQDLERRVAKHDVAELSALEAAVPHAAYDPDTDDIPEHLADIALQSGFLTTQHEEDYLLRMDAKLGDRWSLKQPRPASPPTFASMTPREVEREVELRNPSSVHNWLKKHHVSVADADGASLEAGAPATGKKSRALAKKVGDRAVERAKERDEGSPMSSVVGARTEQDLADDEIGYIDDTPSSGKSKKSRDTDNAYRPKGGRSSKAKRKRESDAELLGGKGKKPRTSISTGGAPEA